MRQSSSMIGAVPLQLPTATESVVFEPSGRTRRRSGRPSSCGRRPCARVAVDLARASSSTAVSGGIVKLWTRPSELVYVTAMSFGAATPGETVIGKLTELAPAASPSGARRRHVSDRHRVADRVGAAWSRRPRTAVPGQQSRERPRAPRVRAFPPSTLVPPVRITARPRPSPVAGLHSAPFSTRLQARFPRRRSQPVSRSVPATPAERRVVSGRADW